MSNLIGVVQSDLFNMMEELKENAILGQYLIPKIQDHLYHFDYIDLPSVEVGIADFVDDVRDYLEQKINYFIRDLKKREVISFEPKCE